METAISGQGIMWRLRNFVFFTGVFLMFYTLQKPSPVDFAYVTAMALCPFVNQRVTRNFLLLVLLLGTWCISFYISSLEVLRDPDVQFETFQKTYAVLLGFLVTFTTMSWQRAQFMTFLKIFVISCVITAVLGIIGFATGIEILTSHGRAKGLINDPNMYCFFLVPGAISCLYLLGRAWTRPIVLAAMGIITVALLLSFSRAGVVALVLCGGFYLIYIYRDNPARLLKYGLIALAGASALVLLLFVFGGHQFTDLLSDRLTVAKDYDLGREGRYARYERAIPIILDNPLGIGVVQDEKIFVEAIHNIWIGSFLLYGWAAGFAWIAFFTFSVAIYRRNQRVTDDPLPTLFFVCFLSTILGTTLHEGEHWRTLWLFTGMVWGMGARHVVPIRAPKTVPVSDRLVPA